MALIFYVVLLSTAKCLTIESNKVESRIGSYYLSSDDVCSTQHRDHPGNETKPWHTALWQWYKYTYTIKHNQQKLYSDIQRVLYN
jgi:hypothetical protein